MPSFGTGVGTAEDVVLEVSEVTIVNVDVVVIELVESLGEELVEELVDDEEELSEELLRMPEDSEDLLLL